MRLSYVSLYLLHPGKNSNILRVEYNYDIDNKYIREKYCTFILIKEELIRDLEYIKKIMYCIYFLLQLTHRFFVFNSEFYFKFLKVRVAFLYKPGACYLNKLCI